MRVSVITPCYNAASTLEETLASVRRQTHADLEHIVIDDGSTDASWQIIRRHRPWLRSQRIAHGGGCRARNRGLALASGEAVLFLDADDVLLPGTIAALVETLQAAPPRCIAAAPWVRYAQRDGCFVPDWAGTPTVPSGDLLEAWLLRRWFAASGALLWPRAIVEELGGWDESLVMNQDGDLAMRALLAGVVIRHTTRGLVLYRNYGPCSTSAAANRSAAAVTSALRVLEKQERAMRETGRLAEYQLTLARAYHSLARLYYADHPDLARTAEARGHALAGRRAIYGSLAHRVVTHLVGLDTKEWLGQRLARQGLGDAQRVARTRSAPATARTSTASVVRRAQVTHRPSPPG